MKTGLKRHYPSRKDFDSHKTFGAFPLSALPKQLLFISEIGDQNGREACTAFASNSVRASMKAKRYNPEAYYEQELIINGTPGMNQGVDLRTLGACATSWGFLPIGETTPTDKVSAYFFIT